MNLRVTLYTRENCHLCDVVKELLDELQPEFPHELTTINIDEYPALKEEYDTRIPVLETGPYLLEGQIDEGRLRMVLGAARDRLSQLSDAKKKVAQRRRARSRNLSIGDRIWYWISHRYILVANIFLFFYVALPFLAPALMNAGADWAARPLYQVYGATCHQFAFRSWFLYGDQSVYPREAAGVEGVVSYGEASGLSEENLWAARSFIGNPDMGYKVAFCERDVAIWGSMLIFGLIYSVLKKRIPRLPWYIWLLVAIGPIGLDGFSQLLSQIPNWAFWGYRESTPFLRTLTGSLFGFFSAWLGFPILTDTFEETQVIFEKKVARAKYKTRFEEEGLE